MKLFNLKYIALALTASLAVGSCASDEAKGDDTGATTSAVITLSTEEVEASAAGATVDVTTSGEWQVASNRSWCSVSAEEGEDNGSFKLTFDENSEMYARSAQVVVSNDSDSKTIEVSQAAGVYSEGMHYKLPVVFHIFYNRDTNAQHYIPQEKIYEIFDYLKSAYANCGQDLGFEFVLAEEAPDGQTLAMPGIDYVQWKIAKISYTDFMFDSYNEYADLMWDPSKYINVSIYEFSQRIAPVGISQSSYLYSADHIDGTVELKTYVEPTELLFPMCVSVNNTYLNSDGDLDSQFNDFKSTVAHELGHLLGLKHVFYEDGASTAGELDTDFCSDTPTYNRLGYTIDQFNPVLSEYYSSLDYGYNPEPPAAEAIESLYFRTDKSGAEPFEFESTNFMDYALGRFTTFSAEQKARMRHLITHSPFLPGCKAVEFTKTKASMAPSEVPVELHVCK